MDNEEILPLVDADGRVVGAASRSECHRGPGRLHPVVHLHVCNGCGSIYLQKRAEDKLVQPGKWDTAVGGHVAAGEEIGAALAREIEEELGVGPAALESSGRGIRPLFRYRWDTEVESELVHAFLAIHEGPFHHDGREVSEGRFWSLDEIRANLGRSVFTPNFEHEFELLQEHLSAAPGGDAP